MLTPNERFFLSQFSNSYLIENIPLIAVGSVSLGATLVLYLYGLWLIRKRGSQGYAVKVVVAGATVCVIAAIAGFGAILAVEAINYQAFSNESSYGPTVKPYDLISAIVVKRLISQFISFFAEYLILGVSDALVIWRTQSLYPDTSKLLITILTISLVTSSTCMALGATSKIYTANGFLEDPQDTLFHIGQTISLFTNVATTFLVGFKLWRHRCWLNKHLADTNFGFSPAQKKMLLIVETGLAFCVVQGICIFLEWTTFWESGYGNMFFNPIRLLQFAFAANYSTTLLILLQTQTSVTDSLCILDNPVHLGDQPLELEEFSSPYTDELPGAPEGHPSD